MNGMTINHIVSIDHGSYQKLGKKLSKQDIHPMHPKVLDAVLGEEMTKTIWSVAWLFRGSPWAPGPRAMKNILVFFAAMK